MCSVCMYVLYVCIRAYICTIYQSALSCFKIKGYINLLCYVMLYSFKKPYTKVNSITYYKNNKGIPTQVQ